MSKLRILYVASEITPFLQTSKVADFVRQIPQAMQERGMEIRILVPRFGIINERKNRLHEVVRLSGINISVGDEEKPLTIKVASIPSAKLQVYFIDNEDYFQRKSVFVDKENRFHDDNDERAIFFCKGVLETIKKLGWSPDIIHCNDWMTSLIPMYLKTTYRKDPVFQHTKSVFSVFNNVFSHEFGSDFAHKARMMDIDDEAIAHLRKPNFENIIRTGIKYADLVVSTEEEYNVKIQDLLKEMECQCKINHIPFDSEQTPALSDSYYNLYNELSSC
ncbi:MAG: glycogen/starch synthase [Raineya sp.]